MTDTGVVPLANEWYRFRILVEDTGVRTNILARVWRDGDAEPVDWQIDCFDNSLTRLTKGTVGFWSMSSGFKYWDDINVE